MEEESEMLKDDFLNWVGSAYGDEVWAKCAARITDEDVKGGRMQVVLAAVLDARCPRLIVAEDVAQQRFDD